MSGIGQVSNTTNQPKPVATVPKANITYKDGVSPNPVLTTRLNEIMTKLSTDRSVDQSKIMDSNKKPLIKFEVSKHSSGNDRLQIKATDLEGNSIATDWPTLEDLEIPIDAKRDPGQGIGLGLLANNMAQRLPKAQNASVGSTIVEPQDKATETYVGNIEDSTSLLGVTQIRGQKIDIQQ